MEKQETEQQNNDSDPLTGLLPITHDQLKGYFWKRPDTYDFAAKDILSELSLKEVPLASVNFPITFVKNKNLTFHLAMLQGFVQGENLLVSREGKWLSHFVPSLYRYHPFVLMQNDQQSLMLYFNNALPLLTKDPDAEPFYRDENQPADLVQQAFNGLVERWQGVSQLLSLVQQLDDSKLIVPWDISIKRSENQVKVEGLYRIDESILSTLSADDLIKLRDSGALTLAYCQMLSMNNLHRLIQLDSERQNKPSPPSASVSEDTLVFGHETDAGLNFDNI